MLETERLIIRNYRASDSEDFYRLNSSEKVMEFFEKKLDRPSSDAVMLKMTEGITSNGYGFWAIELKTTGEFIGFVGLNKPNYDLPIKNSTEIGWRLREDFWGKGYAPEAAKACLKFGFENLKLNQIIAFTPINNKNSQRVMEKIGMKNLNSNFMHPMVDANSPICEHLLYVINKEN